MSQFSFPILDDAELMHCLHDMEVTVDTGALAKPTYEVFRPVFEQLVIELTGVTRDELNQPVFIAMDAFEFPELHDESIPCFNFLTQLTKLMAACGVKDFGWRDVFKPEPPRLRRNLSAIINFCKFRDEKAERAQQAAGVSQLEQQDQDVLQRNTQLNKEQAALQTEVRNLKLTINQVGDAASQAKFDISALQQEHDQLLDEVVVSPDKHRQAIAELAAAAEARRAYYAELSTTAISNELRLETIGKFDKEVGRCIKAQEELDGAITRKKGVSQQVKDARASIAAHERALSDISNAGAQLRRNIATLDDKFQRLEHQAALKLEAAASCVEEQLKSREAVEAENAAIAAKAAEDEAAVRSLQERMVEVQAMHESQVRGVLEKYAVLRKVVSQYNGAVVEATSQPQAAFV
ncbi:hypothetical protein FOA52_015019 [Chlamydomonas sp. UWO 241]|nr:hypothetical protein FOA52_015019 [Chlamydomonas sp. UWO 241]